MKKALVILTIFALALVGCSTPIPIAMDTTPSVHPPSTYLPKVSATPVSIPDNPATITPTAQPSPTLTVISFEENPIYSPLEGISLSQLSEMIFNPYHLPAAGSDDPHQGIDFSDIDPETKIARTGMGVQAILSGRVISVMSDRFPYGNAIMIETDWQDLPSGWQALIDAQPNPVPWKKTSALTCPPGWDELSPNEGKSTLYILYAHMLNKPALKLGEPIHAGDPIGNIGMSGNALAPHVHVEIRYGPSALFPDGMAHYDVSASAEEMSNYCRWRISGWFRPIDPMLILLNQ